MPVNREIKVIKVPLPDSERMPDYPKAFPRMPQLYLELLENKQKIKQELVNKDYVPVDTREEYNHEEKKTNTDTNKDKSKSKDSKSKDSKSSTDSSTDSKSKDSKSSTDSSTDSKSKDSKSSTDSSSSDSESTVSISSDSSVRNARSDGDSESESSDELSNRLKKLLGDSSSSSRSKSKHKDKYSSSTTSPSVHSKYTPYDKYKSNNPPPVIPLPPPRPAPTLTELEQKGHFQRELEYPNIGHMTMDHEDEDRKRELIFKFDLLKKSYPASSSMLPEYSIHSDLKEMQKAYEDNVKRLSLDSTVGTYKTYLIGGFSVVEFVFGNFLGFDMQGFTQQQIINMHSYERLLIELGEKSYVPSGSKWPVEVRLLGIIVINAGIFIVSKMIMKKTGANLMNMINTMNAPPAGAQNSVPKPKRRMKGPNIGLNDIPDVTEEEQAK
jgi:hypothetical protein